MTSQPMQPLEIDPNGTLRFRANSIVRFLLDHGECLIERTGIDAGKLSLNLLARQYFSQEDWEQFYQLIGYSVYGYHELSRVSDESAIKASQLAHDTLGIETSGCRQNGCPVHGGGS